VFSLVSDIVLSVDESSIPQFTIFPNPARHELTVDIKSNEVVQAQIIDLTGKVQAQEVISGSTRLDVSFLKAGVYFVRIEGSNATLKFVKE
jgi:hypothetical protein